MKKSYSIFIIPFSFFLINWSQQNKNTEYCYGIVTFPDGKKEEIVDIKIGRTKSTADNTGIKIFKRPTEATKKDDFIEYHFDLKKISKIELDAHTATAVYDNHEYVHIKIYSPSEEIYADCIIPKEEELIAKVKHTGWTVSYPFNKIRKIEILTCTEDHHSQHEEATSAKETTLLNLEKSLQELEKINKKEHNQEIKDLQEKTSAILESIKNDINAQKTDN